MKKLKVNLAHPYHIYIGQNIVLKLKGFIQSLDLGNHAIVITNKTLYRLYRKFTPRVFSNDKKIKFQFIVLADSEKIKSFSGVLKIFNTLGALDFKKRVFFICWGGGVIGDLGGFVASVYKRGAPYIQIPTTLLSQIDSSIGGKTAIDLKTAKNLVGSFWQPSLVLTDPLFLKTLPTAQIKEGLSEAVKYGLIEDKALFKFIEVNYPHLLLRNQKYLSQLIYRCAKIKKQIIEVDERERKGIRTILNFGHTIGHGIEASSNYQISHGKAIASGMISALYISKKDGILKNGHLITRVEGLLKKNGLARRQKLNKSKIMQAIRRDKKFLNAKTRMVLLKDIAKPVIKENISITDIKKSLDYITYC